MSRNTVLPVESVRVALTMNVPFVAYITVKVVWFPAVAGLPPGAFQPNVYGLVPPDALEVQLTGLPTVPVLVPQLAVIVRGGGAPDTVTGKVPKLPWWEPSPLYTPVIV